MTPDIAVPHREEAVRCQTVGPSVTHLAAVTAPELPAEAAMTSGSDARSPAACGALFADGLAGVANPAATRAARAAAASGGGRSAPGTGAAQRRQPPARQVARYAMTMYTLFAVCRCWVPTRCYHRDGSPAIPRRWVAAREPPSTSFPTPQASLRSCNQRRRTAQKSLNSTRPSSTSATRVASA